MLRGIKRRLRNSSFVKNLREKRQNSQWGKLPKASLIEEINIEKYNPSEIFFIDGKGSSKDIILLKTNGIFGSSTYQSPVFNNKFSFLKDSSQKVFGLFRIDAKGNLLWQLKNDAEGGESIHHYCCHASEEILKIDDIDYDSTEEIITINGKELLVIDSRDGDIKSKFSLPADNFGIVKIIENRVKKEKRILVSVMADAYSEYMYANPTLLFDSKLNLIKEIESIGSGHRIIPVDIDDDGVEEFIDGYEMFDYNGNRIWLLDEFKNREYKPMVDHVDHMELFMSGDEILGAIAGSDFFYWIDVRKGETIWKNKPIHAQYCLIGDFRKSNKEEIFLTNMTHKVQFYGTGGKINWEGSLPDNWPLGKPSNLPSRMFHMGIPANKIRINSDYCILYNEKGWPYCIDGSGNTVLTFPHSSSIKKPHFDLPDHRGDDFGLGFYTRVEDVDNDGKDEAVIFDRRYIWIYKV